MKKRALVGADVFDGQRIQRRKAVLLDGDIFTGLVALDDVPSQFRQIDLGGGMLVPGFVDLQVNGGGGVQFNDQTSVGGLKIIASAHLSTGSRAILPTLITDTPAKAQAAVSAAIDAIAQRVPGIVGLHLEGPHISTLKKGAHEQKLIREMQDGDLTFLLEASRELPTLMVTVAPENVSNEQINALAKAGVIVSLGHTDCSFETAINAMNAGARCVTHLFNAMSQTTSREPGLVGATFRNSNVSAGLIADGFHVHPANIRMALRSKRARKRVFLVSDAMATLGSDLNQFELNGRRVDLENGRLTLSDGTLAGAHIEMSKAVAFMQNAVGLKPATAYAMATSIPASILRDPMGFGTFEPGKTWHGIYINKAGRYCPEHSSSES